MPKRALNDVRLEVGEMRRVEVEGLALLVARSVEGYHAVEDLCSHVDQRLSNGRMRGSTVYCPLHGARFDLRDGRCLAPPATRPIRSFVIEEASGELFVELGDASS